MQTHLGMQAGASITQTLACAADPDRDELLRLLGMAAAYGPTEGIAEEPSHHAQQPAMGGNGAELHIPTLPRLAEPWVLAMDLCLRLADGHERRMLLHVTFVPAQPGAEGGICFCAIQHLDPIKRNQHLAMDAHLGAWVLVHGRQVIQQGTRTGKGPYTQAPVLHPDELGLLAQTTQVQTTAHPPSSPAKGVAQLALRRQVMRKTNTPNLAHALRYAQMMYLMPIFGYPNS